jgi:hypothetical protein
MSSDAARHHAQLRAWAKGIYGMEAATELLIRGFNGRFAGPGNPWVHPTTSGHWIDFDTIPGQIGALSGGEQRFLQITAALNDGDTTVNLGRALAGLDRQHVHLVLAAVAHTSGTHEQREIAFQPDGTVTFARPGAIYGWDQATSPEPRIRERSIANRGIG